MPLPSPAYNFASIPTQDHAGQEARDVVLPLARGEGLLPGAPRGWREVIVGTTGASLPRHVAVLPGNTVLPLLVSAAIGAFVLLMLASLYVFTPIAMLAVIALVWRWGRDLVPPRPGWAPQGTRPERGWVPDPVTVAPGMELPFHWARRDTLVRLGTVCLLIANGTFFAALLFGVAFLSVVAPNWPAPPGQVQGWQAALLVAAPALALVGAALAARRAEARLGAGAMTAGAVLNLVALAAVVALAVLAMDDPTRHARDALRGVLAGYVGLHAVIGLGCAAFARDQVRRAEIGANHAGIVPVWRLWQDFSAATAVISAAVVIGQGMAG
jgi:cytochrome c oxidase subunit I+III